MRYTTSYTDHAYRTMRRMIRRSRTAQNRREINALVSRVGRRVTGDMKLYVWHANTIKQFHPGGPVSIIWTLAETYSDACDMVAQEYDVTWEQLGLVSVYVGAALSELEWYLYNFMGATRPMLPGMRLAQPYPNPRRRNGKMHGYATGRHG